MVDATLYFDLKDVLFNELIGDVMLTTLLGLALVIYLCLKSKTPMEVTILMSMLWITTVFAGYTGLTILWVFVGLGVGVSFYYAINKAIQGR